MTSLFQIKTKLYEELRELCAACDYEHALLEEGTFPEQQNPDNTPAELREAA